jgi:hypothetical protein
VELEEAFLKAPGGGERRRRVGTSEVHSDTGNGTQRRGRDSSRRGAVRGCDHSGWGTKRCLTSLAQK